MRHRTIPYVAHKRLVTGTRSSVARSSITPARTISRIVSVPTFRAATPIRFTTPIPSRYPITPIAVLTSPVRHHGLYISLFIIRTHSIHLSIYAFIHRNFINVRKNEILKNYLSKIGL